MNIFPVLAVYQDKWFWFAVIFLPLLAVSIVMHVLNIVGFRKLNKYSTYILNSQFQEAIDKCRPYIKYFNIYIRQTAYLYVAIASLGLDNAEQFELNISKVNCKKLLFLKYYWLCMYELYKKDLVAADRFYCSALESPAGLEKATRGVIIRILEAILAHAKNPTAETEKQLTAAKILLQNPVIARIADSYLGDSVEVLASSETPIQADAISPLITLPTKTEKDAEKVRKIRLLSILLMLAAIISTIVAFAVVASVSNSNIVIEQTYYMTKNLWIFLIFLVFPLGCLVFGIVYLTKKRKTKKNIVIGSIFSFIFIIFGAILPLTAASAYSLDTTFITQLSSETDIIFPVNATIIRSTYKTTTGALISSDSSIRYTEANGAPYETYIAASSDWWSKGSSTAPTFVPSEHLLYKSTFDYFCIYSYSQDQFSFNIIPSPNELYVYIAASFKMNATVIHEYFSK